MQSNENWELAAPARLDLSDMSDTLLLTTKGQMMTTHYPTAHDVPIGALVVGRPVPVSLAFIAGYKYRHAAAGAYHIIPVECREPDGSITFHRIHIDTVISIDPEPPAPFQHRHVWDEHAAKPWNKNVCGCPEQDHGPTEPEPGDPFTEGEKDVLSEIGVEPY